LYDILPLNERTLAHHARRVATPGYDRRALAPGVLHVGVGAFHRSHQAVYFDDLAGRGHTDWGITGAGLRGRAMQRALVAQDGLYTVVTRDRQGDRARVIGAMTGYLLAPVETDALLAALTDERLRLVTLTITPHGYDVETAIRALRALGAPDASGVAGAHTALGYLVEALDRRRRAGRSPFTVLSCDNIADNGDVTRNAIHAVAETVDSGLAHWIDERGAFPNSMVDRITPTITSSDRDMVARHFGIEDRWPVITEPFSQWVIEEEFCGVRPPLEEVGVQFAADVRPYALAKTRLLNGTHCALAYLGSLAGHRRLDRVMANRDFAEYARRLMDTEVAPLLPDAAELDLPAYAATLRSRLSNPTIADQLERLCRNGSSKIPRHVLASVHEARAAGRPHKLLTLAVAGWCRYLQGVDDHGHRLALNDPDAARLRALARAGGTDPRPLLSEQRIFGSLAADPLFVDALGRDLIELERIGATAVLAARLRSDVLLAAA
jgi:mannitol 2-dehydrogenase